MVNDLKNYFSDWIRVGYWVKSLSEIDDMVEFCTQHFGVRGGVWDIIRESNPNANMHMQVKTVWFHYFTFKSPHDAFLYQLRFSNRLN